MAPDAETGAPCTVTLWPNGRYELGGPSGPALRVLFGTERAAPAVADTEPEPTPALGDVEAVAVDTAAAPFEMRVRLGRR